jgi:RNA polymerase sigma-70 factor (ECF subfamily)
MDDPQRAERSDAELITLAQRGESEAFGELYQRYLDPIFRYLRMRVNDLGLAEDLTEMVFLRAFESLGSYRERGHPFSAYLYRVARNLLVDHYRRREEVPLEQAPALTSPTDVAGMVARREQLRSVLAALAELPEDHQEVIRLRVILALPTAEVAAWMGRSEGAVRVLLHRALKSLREQLPDAED